MDTAAHTRMVRARAELVLGHPFFAALALRLPLKEDTACRTAWTNGSNIGYNPDRVRSMSIPQLAGIIGHEVMHVACGHHLRRMGRDEQLWNLACDHAINWICIEAGLELPEGYADDPDLRDLPVEEIYARLLSKKGDEEHGGSNSGSEGESVEVDEEHGASESRLGDEQEEGGGAGQAENDPDGEEEGESDDSEGDAGEQSSQGNDSAGTGEIRDAQPADGAGGQSNKDQQEELHQMLVQAELAIRDMGDLPAGIQRILSEVLRPPLPWQELLARYIENNARNDYSWIMPNRRYLHMGLHLPELRNMELPEIAVAIDTSGSVRPAELDLFAAELSAILENFDTTVHVIYCDAQVSGHSTFTRADLPLSLTATGGGGTDFRPVFEHVEQRALTPACLVYLTDMECNRFPEEPAYPVLWISPTPRTSKPPFGELITMPAPLKEAS